MRTAAPPEQRSYTASCLFAVFTQYHLLHLTKYGKHATQQGNAPVDQRQEDGECDAKSDANENGNKDKLEEEGNRLAVAALNANVLVEEDEEKNKRGAIVEQ